MEFFYAFYIFKTYHLLGKDSIIEETCKIVNSNIGESNLIEVGCELINSNVGSQCIVGSRVKLVDCNIGNRCYIAATLSLHNVTIPDDTAVFYRSNDGWQVGPANIDYMLDTIESYRKSLIDPTSPQYLGNTNTFHEIVKKR